MKFSWALLFPILVSGCAPSKPSCQVTPADFCQAFATLAADLSDEQKLTLARVSASDIRRMHRGYGMTVRNQLGLWQDNELTRYFNSKGIRDPEAMSAPVIGGLALYVQGKPVDMAQMVVRYPPPALPPPPGWKPSDRMRSR
jgi:hypothetical protein